MSMIADMFSAGRRGTAIGVATVGSALGFALGSALAGFLNDRFDWHIALMAVGAPGVVLALILWLMVREPSRGAHDGGGAAPGTRETFTQCLRRCAGIRTLWPFAIGWISLQVCFSGWLTWVPAFLMRVDHLSAAKMGGVFGGIIACSIVAALLGGPISDWLARRGARWRLYYCCLAMTLSIPLLAASSLAPSLAATIGLLVAYTLVSGGIVTVATATYVSFAPWSMRGFVTALMNLFAAVLGAGAAPAIFGAVNDLLKPNYGDQSLRFTLLIAPAAMAVACVMFLVASRTVDGDVKLASRPGRDA
jgi:MFS family permease